MQDNQFFSISVKDMLFKMKDLDQKGQRKSFSLTFITCNTTKGTGGERITINNAILITDAADLENEKHKHFEHYTRNIKNEINGDIHKIRPLLVEKFNNTYVGI